MKKIISLVIYFFKEYNIFTVQCTEFFRKVIIKHKRKLSLLLALILGVTPVLTSVNQSKSYAEEQKEITFEEFINYVDSNIVVNNNNLYEIKNEAKIQEYINKNIENISLFLNVKTKEEAFSKIKARIEQLNDLSKNQKIIILKNKKIYDKSKITLRSIIDSDIGELSTFWWGYQKNIYIKQSSIQFC